MLKSAANPVDIPYNLSFRESLALMRKRYGSLERELLYFRNSAGSPVGAVSPPVVSRFNFSCKFL